MHGGEAYCATYKCGGAVCMNALVVERSMANAFLRSLFCALRLLLVKVKHVALFEGGLCCAHAFLGESMKEISTIWT